MPVTSRHFLHIGGHTCHVFLSCPILKILRNAHIENVFLSLTVSKCIIFAIIIYNHMSGCRILSREGRLGFYRVQTFLAPHPKFANERGAIFSLLFLTEG